MEIVAKAQSLGWEVELAECDKRAGRSIENAQDCLSYRHLGVNRTIWACGEPVSKGFRMWWQCRDFDKETKIYAPYETRREYEYSTEGLLLALETECKL